MRTYLLGALLFAVLAAAATEALAVDTSAKTIHYRQSFTRETAGGWQWLTDTNAQVRWYPAQEDTTGQGIDATYLANRTRQWEFTPTHSDVWDAYEVGGPGPDSLIASGVSIFAMGLDSTMVTLADLARALTPDNAAAKVEAYTNTLVLESGINVPGHFTAGDGEVTITEDAEIGGLGKTITSTGTWSHGGGTFEVGQDFTADADVTVYGNVDVAGWAGSNGDLTVAGTTELQGELVLPCVADTLGALISTKWVMVPGVQELKEAGWHVVCDVLLDIEAEDIIGGSWGGAGSRRTLYAAPASQDPASADSVVWGVGALGSASQEFPACIRCRGVIQ